MKACRTCGENKPEDEFYRGRSDCKACHNEATVRYTRARRYGLTVKQLDKLLANADRCHICDREFDDPRSIHIDHDHNTGKVRGLLCNGCNCGLGLFREEVAALQSAIRYLRRHKRASA